MKDTINLEGGRFTLTKTTEGVKATGYLSSVDYDDYISQPSLEEGVTNTVQIGKSVLIFHVRGFYLTSPVVELLEHTDSSVMFKTESGSIYIIKLAGDA